MLKHERYFILITLLAISFFAIFDLVTDLKEGVTWWHVSFEAFVAIIAGAGFIYLLKGTFELKKIVEAEKKLSGKLFEENERYKQQSKSYIDGLSSTINEQLSKWELTKSEKEVAFLIIKGFSLKEVAEIRGTSEKTARTQSAAIYAKAGLANRSQLAAFFLEDLLMPN